MSTELIFYTQVATFIALLVAVFGLCRVLTRHRNSMIALLLDQHRSLSVQLEQLSIQLSNAMVNTRAAQNNGLVLDAQVPGGEAADKKKRSEQEAEEVLVESQRLVDESKTLLNGVSRRSSTTHSIVHPKEDCVRAWDDAEAIRAKRLSDAD